MLITLFVFSYADRAKRIKNKAVVNESATDKLIRMLKEENDRLKKELGGNISLVSWKIKENKKNEGKKEKERERRRWAFLP